MSKEEKRVFDVLPHLEQFLMPIDSLVPLPGNPRKGEIDSIVASYKEFGQVRAIVVVPNGDDTYTVVAGNHQLEAAKQMGWTHIAAAAVNWNEARGRAFAVVDNRTAELGHTDETLLYEMLTGITDQYETVLTGMGWDDFEMAAMEDHYLNSQKTDTPWGTGDTGPGWTPPEMIQVQEAAIPTTPETFSHESQSEKETHDAVVQGAPAVGREGARAAMQHTLVFDHADQLKDWYAFLRWLKAHPNYSEEHTTAAQLMSFLRDASDF